MRSCKQNEAEGKPDGVEGSIKEIAEESHPVSQNGTHGRSREEDRNGAREGRPREEGTWRVGEPHR
jgi:hypothetical protein